jgi:hypothetical protein
VKAPAILLLSAVLLFADLKVGLQAEYEAVSAHVYTFDCPVTKGLFSKVSYICDAQEEIKLLLAETAAAISTDNLDTARALLDRVYARIDDIDKYMDTRSWVAHIGPVYRDILFVMLVLIIIL